MNSRRSAWISLVTLCGWTLALAAYAAEPAKSKSKLDVWYVPTPYEVVDRMLD
jgi:hypothetical protein